MKLLEQLHRWVQCFRRNGEDPAFVPLTAEELFVVASECRCNLPIERFMVPNPPCADAVTGSKFYGCDVFESPFAPDMRQRQIDMAVTQLEESAEVPMYREVCSEDRVRDIMRRRLIAHICSDTTRLDLTFEFDCWAKFKRKLRIEKWWLVKTRTVVIEGRVLYPYLKVSLPHNKHRVQFKHV